MIESEEAITQLGANSKLLTKAEEFTSADGLGGGAWTSGEPAQDPGAGAEDVGEGGPAGDGDAEVPAGPAEARGGACQPARRQDGAAAVKGAAGGVPLREAARRQRLPPAEARALLLHEGQGHRRLTDVPSLFIQC
ncbi:hypothetical protein ZWY2020_055241 [Hordeum vulgare]|nr:hypothetical protein ZWY2020_055241 [Hordeum vulgare]